MYAQIKENGMVGTCSMYGGYDKFVYGFGREIWKKEAISKT